MTKPEGVLAGGCLCGAVRYQLEGAKITDVAHCHCTMCQRAAGAPVVTWVTLPSAALAWTKGAPKIYRSSAEAERGFCASCGGALTFQFTARPEEIDVTAASLDDPDAVTPTSHIWTESKLRWLNLADGLPTHPQWRDQGTTE